MGFVGAFLFLFLERFLYTPNYTDITKLVGILVSMREPYDSHGSRVAVMAARLATELGMRSNEIRLIGIGAHLHDIGKLLVRLDLLNATRKLNDAERAEMQNHVRLGWHIVHQAEYDPTVQAIVLYHHERWNGKGYPSGLMGDAIPVAAQVVAIADVYEAMTNARPYREAYDAGFTAAYMRARKTIDFDAQLVDVFLDKVVKHE